MASDAGRVIGTTDDELLIAVGHGAQSLGAGQVPSAPSGNVCTLYMQRILHYSALRTGFSYLPLGFAPPGRGGYGAAFRYPTPWSRRTT